MLVDLTTYIKMYSNKRIVTLVNVDLNVRLLLQLYRLRRGARLRRPFRRPTHGLETHRDHEDVLVPHAATASNALLSCSKVSAISLESAFIIIDFPYTLFRTDSPRVRIQDTPQRPATPPMESGSARGRGGRRVRRN